MRWWRKHIERLGKDYPVALALSSLVLGLALGGAGSFAAFNAGWFAGTSKPVASFTEQLQGAATRVVTEQKCQQQMGEARISGFNEGREKASHACVIETFLEWYEKRIEELARRAQALLDKPNASEQQKLNADIDDTIQQGEQTRARLKEIADALDSDAAKVRDLVLKQGSPAAINAQMIALANIFPGKRISASRCAAGHRSDASLAFLPPANPHEGRMKWPLRRPKERTLWASWRCKYSTTRQSPAAYQAQSTRPRAQPLSAPRDSSAGVFTFRPRSLSAPPSWPHASF